MMHKIYKVAEREFLETVKTKTFLITAFLVPLLIVGGMVVSIRLTRKTIEGDRPKKTIGVTDLSKDLYPRLESAFQSHNERNQEQKIEIEPYEVAESELEAQTEQRKKDVRNGKLDGHLVLAKDVVEGDGKSFFYMKAKNIVDLETLRTIRRLVNSAVRDERIEIHNLSPELLAEIYRGISIEEVDLSTKEGKKRNEMEMILAPFFFLMLMFVGVFGINQQMLTSVIEEKTARVMEVILSAVTPFELMTGKILGLATAGFTLVIIWSAAGIGMVIWRGMLEVMSVELAVYFVIYYILGFLLFSSIMAAVGSVCNTIKEAQNLMMPISMLIIMPPMLLWFPISQNANGALAVVFSFIPPVTPMIMMLRIPAEPGPSFFQIILSIVLLAASVPAVMWAAAKVFRTGVLMYGKPPSLRELARWVRHK